MRQRTLTATGFERFGKTTRRAAFLAEMEQAVPWSKLCALIEPVYPTGESAGHQTRRRSVSFGIPEGTPLHAVSGLGDQYLTDLPSRGNLSAGSMRLEAAYLHCPVQKRPDGLKSLSHLQFVRMMNERLRSKFAR